jgi:hypothetical protein
LFVSKGALIRSSRRAAQTLATSTLYLRIMQLVRVVNTGKVAHIYGELALLVVCYISAGINHGGW